MISVKGVSHVVYHSWDRDESLKFFVDVFGFYPQIRGPVYYCGIGDVLVELFNRDAPEVELVWTDYEFGLEVPDVEESIKELEALGTQVLKPAAMAGTFYGHQAVIAVPGGMPMAIRDYRDNDGPHFTGWQPRAKS